MASGMLKQITADVRVVVTNLVGNTVADIRLPASTTADECKRHLSLLCGHGGSGDDVKLALQDGRPFEAYQSLASALPIINSPRMGTGLCVHLTMLLQCMSEYVVVPRGCVAAAIVGRGMFTPEEMPPQTPGVPRIGFCSFLDGRFSALAGAEAFLNETFERTYLLEDVHVNVFEEKAVSALGVDITCADDWQLITTQIKCEGRYMQRAKSAGLFVQLFELAAPTIIHTEVRVTSDINHVEGRFQKMAIPADASSAVTRALLLASMASHPDRWCRLAAARCNLTPVAFPSLAEHVRRGHLEENNGLCISYC